MALIIFINVLGLVYNGASLNVIQVEAGYRADYKAVLLNIRLAFSKVRTAILIDAWRWHADFMQNIVSRTHWARLNNSKINSLLINKQTNLHENFAAR